MGQTLIGHSLLKRYVTKMYRLLPDSQSLIREGSVVGDGSDRIELVTMDLFGRSRKRAISSGQLSSSPDHQDCWHLSGTNDLLYISNSRGHQSEYFKNLSVKIHQQNTNSQ